MDVRADVLRELVPRLEHGAAGAGESDELTDELWGELACSPHALLDPRGDGEQLGIERLTCATEALATARQTFLMPLLLSALPSVAVLLDGTDEQRMRLLEPLRNGEARAAYLCRGPRQARGVVVVGRRRRVGGRVGAVEGVEVVRAGARAYLGPRSGRAAGR